MNNNIEDKKEWVKPELRNLSVENTEVGATPITEGVHTFTSLVGSIS